MLLAIVLALFLQQPDYSQWFTNTTLRVDYIHTGTTGEEHITLDELIEEGDWPGSRTYLADDVFYGKYRFEVHDSATGTEIYSRGFSSIFGEYETIGEARQGGWRSFEETQRFPYPQSTVIFSIHKRDSANNFEQIYSTVINHQTARIRNYQFNGKPTIVNLLKNGPPEKKVDLLVLGDGYTNDARFESDLKRLTDYFFSIHPFSKHKGDFNVTGIRVPSPVDGVSDPNGNVRAPNPLGFSYNAFGSDRYMLSYQEHTIRDWAATQPYDALIIITADSKYGGGGIYNLWAVTSANHTASDFVFVHEFGHSFAGLGDEYYTSDVAYEDFNPVGVEPWEPNVTALLNPANLKWRHLVDDDMPLPTPWAKIDYDNTHRVDLLTSDPHYGKVGAFEGAGYESTGLYRPELDCIMFRRGQDRFCAVCAEAIVKLIQTYKK